MRKRLFLALLFAPLGLHAQTLKFQELRDRAVQNSAKIKQTEAGLNLAEAQKQASLSQVYPKLSANYTQSYAEESVRKSKEGSTVSLSGEQILFKGLAEFRALSAAELLVQAAKAKVNDEKNTLSFDVAKLLANTAANFQKLKIYAEYSELLERRHKELQNRSRIGKSRDVDVMQTELEKLSLERKRDQSLVDKADSLNELESLMGEKISEEKLPSLDSLLIDLKNESYPTQAAGLKTRQLSLESKQKEISAKRGSYFPTLSAYGNYYPYGRKAYASQEDTWDAGLKLSWTFFSGFSTISEVSQTQAEEEALAAEKREFERSLKLQSQDLKLSRSQLENEVKNLERSLEIAKKAYTLQERDYRFGVVTSLEVLSTLQQQLDIQIDLLGQKSTLIQSTAQAFTAGSF